MIKVENLSKRYVIGHQRQERYNTLRDAIANGARSLKQKIFSPQQKLTDPAHEEFWALKDVSFEIKQGDRVGIIGRNGAGKSTLLKILSRITEPTSGRISIKGRVASLLEVGTGFHPELSGRENILLNGAILGMSRAEINKKFDEIVDFAEVAKFLDTPVKHYSSGMYVRLAFAVAAHLEPEILIVDEVLAVGDAAFQKKCLGKMEDVAEKEGRTVLFVSHNMAAIEKLCPLSFLIEKGSLVGNSHTNDCINQYWNSNKKTHCVDKYIFRNSNFDFYCMNISNQKANSVPCGSGIKFCFEFYQGINIPNIDFQIAIFSASGNRIMTISSRFQSQSSFKIDKPSLIYATLEKLPLSVGTYDISFSIYENNLFLEYWESVFSIEVYPFDYYKTGRLPDSGMGSILSDCSWSSLPLTLV
ncbi:ATP-binding cassette domain-containing protein [Pseudanabaena sp. FACHB-1277]|uniref:ATP-binding cassette domain-containing protein n=1 Tax=Pseudanabaena cinerea FACHB-1277 TaxID=2949581 RepID=A0A926UQB4_9CYAN|nr:ATP-binding cassette domain-containing protein [Pseudanabaena cinerea FACHB-1277]